MDCNILIDKLPVEVQVGGVRYPVNYGYRAFMLIEMALYDETASEDQKLLNILNLFYKRNIPRDIPGAVDRLMWFYRCGREVKEGRGGGGGKVRCYDFDWDASYIFSAFLTQYRMDLQETANDVLHWWKFRAMFEALDENLKMSRIIYYRTVDTSGMSKNQRKCILEMKKRYALPVHRAAESHLGLMKRNQDMREYLRRRYREAYGGKQKGG